MRTLMPRLPADRPLPHSLDGLLGRRVPRRTLIAGGAGAGLIGAGAIAAGVRLLGGGDGGDDPTTSAAPGGGGASNGAQPTQVPAAPAAETAQDAAGRLAQSGV